MPLIECASPESLAGILAHERAHTFDLTQEFPMRAVLVHCASDEHVLLVTIHHIATDGWSMGIFKRELGALYSAQHSGIAPSLDPLPATYADFAEQQALSLAEPGCAARLEYWQTMLAEPPPPLTFAPRADAGPATFSGGLRSRVLAPATRAALDAFCRAEGTTEFAVLYAVFAELLHRSTGQRDFVLGSVVANRAQPEFAGLIGFFVNTVALRVRIDAGRTFRSWLGDVGRTIVEAFDHHDVPFEKVVEAVRPVRTATRTPLINVMMVFQNAPDDGLELAGIEVEPLALERTTAKFDLTLEVTTTPDRAITIAFEYRTDLFAEATIEALLTDLEELTATSLAEPDGRLAPFVADQTPQRDSPATAIAGGPPAPSIRASGADLELEPAEAEARVALRSIWESVLGVTPIGLAENFFDIGGHSLLAVRVMNEIQQTFGIVVPVSLLFAEPTIEQLARALTSPPFTPSAEAVVTYNAAGTAAPFFFFHGSITGNGTYCRVLAERVGPDRPLHVLRPHGSDGAPVPASIEAMAAESLGVIRRLAPRGPYLLGGYCAGGLVAFEVARLLRAAGEEVLDVLLIDVPDAPTGMLAVADGIDRVGALLHIDRHQRLRLTGGIARVPHHGIRFASTSTKVDFVKARLSRALHRSAPSDPGTAVATAQRNTYIDWVRRTEAHVPRRYDGRVSLFLTREEGPSAPGDRGGWLRIAPRARVRSIAGTHVNCVTEFIDSTATAVAETIAVHIDERATSSTAEITR
jgi:thioesterase domain-containing protein/acyl carrier protein